MRLLVTDRRAITSRPTWPIRSIIRGFLITIKWRLIYHSDCEDTSDTVCQQQSWWGLDSPGRSYVSSTRRCFSVISLGIKQACKNKTRRKFLQVSGRHLLPLSCFETKERQLFYCFVWIILGIFRSERFSHFSFIFSCMYNLSVSRWSDKSSVVFMCNTNFDSELIFYACVPTKKIVFLLCFL